ncbi:NAD(P)/FAD-dependent oxidoreductase [Thalassobacillus sp. CUG 92003]|uniref:NAD(P)/FAD-dependent oxidoreductase n=1 Tax=Thalassobacillus sp. CUG 92003 TaxID=2736641 RepID=UPI0015E742B1|nr:NAD(P)/FAD-dependent oxidoreductase [Thalassobacillus sp. CUG 92003]
MDNEQDLYDLTIIGGGTTGLFGAYYAGMRDMKTKILEYHSDIGGKVSFFYPEKMIYDVGGIPGVMGEELVEQMKDQALSVHPELVTGVYVTSLQKQADGTFAIRTSDNQTHYSKTVLLATGFGTFDMVPLNVEERTEYENHSIHYTINHMDQFSNKTVMVVSSGRIGIDWALALESRAEKVYLINKGDTFQHVSDADLTALQQSTVEVSTQSSVTSLTGSGQQLTQAEVYHQQEDTSRSLKIDHILVYEGLKMEKAPFEDWGLDTDKNRLTVKNNMETSEEGVFAAGDAVNYPNKTTLIASGYSEAMTAVNSAKTHIEPTASKQVYSTVVYRKK